MEGLNVEQTTGHLVVRKVFTVSKFFDFLGYLFFIEFGVMRSEEESRTPGLAGENSV